MSDATFTAAVVQFFRPFGDRKIEETELPIEVQPAYEEMRKSGCRFEAEVLATGMVSMTISNPKTEEDIDISLTRNGPEVQAGMVEMLKRGLWKG